MNLPQKSVFDDDVDVTDMDAEQRVKAMDSRWRFTGPWLAGMTQGEYNKWLAKEVRPKRPAFREFLKKKLAENMHEVAAQKALDKGEPKPAPIDPSSVTEDQLIDYLRRLRHNNQELYDMVGQFLDLAPLKPPSLMTTGLPSGTKASVQLKDVKNPWAESGPPLTHPSAGLTYLRTSMYMENHPVYGPQKYHAPVEARVVRPRRQLQGASAKLGVAGFIANSQLGDTAANLRNTSSDIFDRVDPELKGGAKTWVHPQQARLDSNGRVFMYVGEANAEAKLVAQELVGQTIILGTERKDDSADRKESANEIRSRYRAQDPPAMSSARDYGLQE
jgi:hypothetical protein